MPAVLLAGIFMLATALWLPASHSVILTGVPQYHEEAYTWCGPAAAQMIMQGYPSSGCTELQEDIWPEIVNFRVESVWDTDPVGLEKAMESLCPPSGGWSVFHNSSSSNLLYWVAYYMTTNQYPVGLLLSTDAHNPGYPSHQEHWVVVTGITTDVTPVGNTSVNLESIVIHDPGYGDLSNTNIVRFFYAADFATLFTAVNKPASSYNGEYVAVIEPPLPLGRVIIPKEILKGRIIDPRLALEQAKKWLLKYNLFEMEHFKKLADAKPLEPMLVDKAYGGYYLIPYAPKDQNPHAIGAVLINAYKGNLKEVGIFQPMAFMTRDQAVRAAQSYLKIESSRQVNAELVTRIKGRNFGRYSPVWKVELDGIVVHVDQHGKIYSHHLPGGKAIKPPSRSRWSASLHGGLTFPITDLGSRYNSSYMVALDLDYHFSSKFSAVVLLGFNHFKAASALISDFHWWNLSANLKWEFSTNPLRPYVNGGIGLYIPKTGATKPGFNIGVGMDRTLNPNLVLEVGMDYHHILTNYEDPEFYTAHAGVIWRF